MGTTANQKKLFFNLRKAKSRISAAPIRSSIPDRTTTVRTSSGCQCGGSFQPAENLCAAGVLVMLDLFIGFVVGCAVGYVARGMLSRYRRERVRRERVEGRYGL
jgi:hypothetical protein